MAENATIVQSAQQWKEISVFLCASRHKNSQMTSQRGHEISLSWPKGNCSKLLFSTLLHQPLPKSPKPFMLANPMISLYLHLLSHIQHSWTHLPGNTLFLWFLRHPFVLTCLLPTCPPLLSPPGWHLLSVSTLHLRIPPGPGPPPSFSSFFHINPPS